MELKEILQKIASKELNYGEDKDYYFMLDEDGRIILLKRNHSVLEDEDGEPRKGYWSQYIDEIVWEAETADSRGLDIISDFLSALDIDYAG